jgi:hypothetical protein
MQMNSAIQRKRVQTQNDSTTKNNSQSISFMMGTHKRTGQKSFVSLLDRQVLEKIVYFTKEIVFMVVTPTNGDKVNALVVSQVSLLNNAICATCGIPFPMHFCAKDYEGCNPTNFLTIGAMEKICIGFPTPNSIVLWDGGVVVAASLFPYRQRSIITQATDVHIVGNKVIVIRGNHTGSITMIDGHSCFQQEILYIKRDSGTPHPHPNTSIVFKWDTGTHILDVKTGCIYATPEISNGGAGVTVLETARTEFGIWTLNSEKATNKKSATKTLTPRTIVMRNHMTHKKMWSAQVQPMVVEDKGWAKEILTPSGVLCHILSSKKREEVVFNMCILQTRTPSGNVIHHRTRVCVAGILLGHVHHQGPWSLFQICTKKATTTVVALRRLVERDIEVFQVEIPTSISTISFLDQSSGIIVARDAKAVYIVDIIANKVIGKLNDAIDWFHLSGEKNHPPIVLFDKQQELDKWPMTTSFLDFGGDDDYSESCDGKWMYLYPEYTNAGLVLPIDPFPHPL